MCCVLWVSATEDDVMDSLENLRNCYKSCTWYRPQIHRAIVKKKGQPSSSELAFGLLSSQSLLGVASRGPSANRLEG